MLPGKGSPLILYGLARAIPSPHVLPTDCHPPRQNKLASAPSEERDCFSCKKHSFPFGLCLADSYSSLKNQLKWCFLQAVLPDHLPSGLYT